MSTPDCPEGSNNVSETKLCKPTAVASMADPKATESEHHTTAHNNLEDVETVRTKYAVTVDSMVLGEPLNKLLQTQYIQPGIKCLTAI